MKYFNWRYWAYWKNGQFDEMALAIFMLSVVLASFFLTRSAIGQELKTKYYLKAGECSFQDALNSLPDGATLYTEGVFYDGFKINKRVYDKGIIIDGGGKTLLFGYSGSYDRDKGLIQFNDSVGSSVTESYNPARHYFLANWNTLTIMDSHNVTVKNLEVWGGCSESISLNDSYPEIGLKNITLENVTALYGGSRGLFCGGHWGDGITLKNCKISEVCYGDTTHCVYFSGGHWDGKYPGFSGIRILATEVSYSGGRHCIQFNGRFSGVEVEGCTLRHGQLAGISSIGVQNAVFRNNTIYGCNRQCIVIYEDGDDDGDWDDPNFVSWWKSCHWPNKNLLIENNTLVVGPKRWKYDQWHGDDPKNHSAILVNNPIHHIRPGIEFRNENIVIRNNVIWQPKQEGWLDIYHDQEANALTVAGNWIWTPSGHSGIAKAGKYHWTEDWEKIYPGSVYANQFIDPKFSKPPTYSDEVNTSASPLYWFGRDFESKANLFSLPAALSGKGAKLQPVKWTPNVMKEK